MKKTAVTLLILLIFVAVAAADDFKYQVKTDDSLKTASSDFHKIMGPLWHGPLEDGKTEDVVEQLPALLKARDAMMKANLPEEFAHNLDVISEKALKFSNAVDSLAKAVKAEETPENIKKAFSLIHDYYREVKTLTLALADVTGRFHDVMAPLWHEAYENKDIKAIKGGVADLLKWGEMIVKVNTGKGGEIEEASIEIVKAVKILEKACAGDDAKKIMNSLSDVHDCYHMLSEDAEHEEEEVEVEVEKVHDHDEDKDHDHEQK